MNSSGSSTSSTVVQLAGEQQQPEVIPYLLRVPHVSWDDAVVDNEFLNKKSSKKCCIYKRPRKFDETDSEESDYERPQKDYPFAGKSGPPPEVPLDSGESTRDALKSRATKRAHKRETQTGDPCCDHGPPNEG